MPSQQRLIQIQIKRLKNLVDITIDFEEKKRLTAILGPNGFGKSTVLHALAASFKPIKVQQSNTASLVGDDYRYIDFFPNTPYGTWSNTDFNVVHFFREGANTQTLPLKITKSIRQWEPIAKKRPEREVYFIGVNSSIPAIELEWPRRKITFLTQEFIDADSLEIRQKAGIILNRDYTGFHSNQVQNFRASSLIGVKYQGASYSALSMGAGEQRLFRILRKVKSAGKYSLILIDELDILLHTDALHRLLKVLNEYAEDKSLQIIFTTHRESVVNLEFESFVSVRHLFSSSVAPYTTFCFKETKPDTLTRLTGKPSRPLSVCCEDDVSTAIIEKIAQQVGVRRFVEISRFGAADNCFTLAAALLLSPQSVKNSILVLDGDVYATTQLREARINKVLTGEAQHDAQRRIQALSIIIQFNTKDNCCPEKMLHQMIVSVELGADEGENEVIKIAREILAVDDPHDYVNNIISSLGEDRSVGIRRIIEVASKSFDAWGEYIAPIKSWLEQKRPELTEN